MSARFNVKCVLRRNGEVVDIQHVYVSAADSTVGMRRAAKIAVKRLAKTKKPGFQAGEARCVG